MSDLVLESELVSALVLESESVLVWALVLESLPVVEAVSALPLGPPGVLVLADQAGVGCRTWAGSGRSRCSRVAIYHEATSRCTYHSWGHFWDPSSDHMADPHPRMNQPVQYLCQQVRSRLAQHPGRTDFPWIRVAAKSTSSLILGQMMGATKGSGISSQK